MQPLYYLRALAGQTGGFLTVNRVVKSFEHISNQYWFGIAIELGLPYFVISSIQVSQLPNDQASLTKVVEWWFQNTANPEWSTIRQVLEGIVETCMPLNCPFLRATNIPSRKSPDMLFADHQVFPNAYTYLTKLMQVAKLILEYSNYPHVHALLGNGDDVIFSSLSAFRKQVGILLNMPVVVIFEVKLVKFHDYC
jgi:hypothetical protein